MVESWRTLETRGRSVGAQAAMIPMLICRLHVVLGQRDPEKTGILSDSQAPKLDPVIAESHRSARVTYVRSHVSQ